MRRGFDQAKAQFGPISSAGLQVFARRMQTLPEMRRRPAPDANSVMFKLRGTQLRLIYYASGIVIVLGFISQSSAAPITNAICYGRYKLASPLIHELRPVRRCLNAFFQKPPPNSDDCHEIDVDALEASLGAAWVVRRVLGGEAICVHEQGGTEVECTVTRMGILTITGACDGSLLDAFYERFAPLVRAALVE